jgi:uncharacterized protein (DUF433 family)
MGKNMSESRIVKTDGVCGGSACVKNTRIPVYVLESFRRQGLPDAELLSEYPTLTADDLRAAWSYVEENRDEIEREIAENNEA